METTAGETHSLRERAKHELARFAVMVVYLWVMFSLFNIHRYLILAENHIPYERLGVSVVNALVFGKVMVVADGFRLQRFLGDRPLIVPILARAVGFALLFIVVDVLEAFLLGAIHHKTLAESAPSYGGGGLAGAMLTGVIMAFALIPFFAFEEIDAALGGGRLGALLLGERKTKKV